MRKVFGLLLTSLIVMLTMSLMFTSVVSAGDAEAVEIGGKIYYLEKGDLLYTTAGLFGHIGIYSGNGKVIDAHPDNELGVNENKIEDVECNFPQCQCYKVETTQLIKGNAVAWAKGKHGKNYSLWPPTPCDAGDKWYCSELVYCAYINQGIILGDISIDRYIHPSSIVSDDDVESVSQECPAGSPNAGAYYAPGTTEDGCCKWSGQCFNGNQPSKCSACYGGSWHSGQTCCSGLCVDTDTDPNNCGSCGNVCGANAHCSGGACHCNEGYKNCDGDWSNGCECSGECCGAGTPNAVACYNPANPENGCCEYASCYDGTHPPDKCTTCYGGSWHSGWQCEGGECVPEASTLVLLATGLLFLVGYLGLRRKEN